MLHNTTHFTEHLKSTNVTNTINQSIFKNFYNMQDVLDTENITTQLTKYLNQLKNQSNSNISNWNFTPEEYGYYITEEDFTDYDHVINKIHINKPSDLPGEEQQILDKYNYILITCRDGMILINDENEIILNNKKYRDRILKWYYYDLTQQDIKDIATYLYNKANENESQQNLKYTNIRKKVKNNNYTRENIIKKALEEISNECSYVKSIFPRGNQRTSIFINNTNAVDGELTVQYRRNANEPYSTVCKFYAVLTSNTEISITCLNTNNQEIWTGEFPITLNQSQNEYILDNVKFVKPCMINAFDDYYKN